MPFIKQVLNGNVTNVIAFKEQLTVGRARDNDIVIDDPIVSQYHAKVSLHNEAWYLSDCGSTNGVFFGREKTQLDERVILQDAAVFTLGSWDFEFLLSEPEQLDKTLRIKKSWIPGVYYTE